MNRIFPILSIGLVLLGGPRAAAASSGLIVTFGSIPERVRRDNPGLAAARLRVREAIGRMKQAGRRDNPELEGGLEGNHHFNEGKLEVGLAQRFPVTNRLQLEKDLSAIEVHAAEAEIKEVERRLIAEARTALVEVLALRQQRRMREQQADVSGELASFTAASAAKGELSPIDAGQARLEAARFASEIRQLAAKEVAAVGKLKPVLGMSPAETLNVTGTLPPPALPAGVVDPGRRPDFRAAKLEAQAAARSVELEKARRYDDVEAGIVAGLERSEDAPEGFENEGIIGFRVKLALPFWDKNEGNIEAAEARAERKEKEVAALVHTIRHEADSARKEMMEWSKMLREIDGKLLPLAAEQAVAAEGAYRDGLSELQAVLRAREQQLQLKASRIEALKNFHLARVRFEAAVANP
ncbi:MAG: TolC family protein [Akkermansiaceae bacterium]|nr:TolC family protein [Akkermansiaceae bacterium]NNM30030.1 TolC family protein [Akkermansiaceae bacterium]